MSNHTPQPWILDGVEIRSTACNEQESICVMSPGFTYQDAAVIFCAPSLLSALEQVTDCLTKCLTGGEVSAKLAGKALERASKIIALAKCEREPDL